MNDHLLTYLHDHLAGSKFAIELLQRLRDSRPDSSLGKLAAKILAEVIADRELLQGLSDRIGSDGSLLKEAGAWMAERASRLKLRLGNDVELGEFETLEMLSLGVLGKLKLWAALDAIAPNESRLSGIDFSQLMNRAQSQHDELEKYRIAAAKESLVKRS